MSSQLPAAGDSQQDAGDGYFAPLASARYMLLTTFKPDGGAPMNSPVRVAVDGDRAYFRTRNGSGASKRLARTGRVQVAPCTVLGLCSFGPPFNATARLLAGEQACTAARKLASTHPVRHRMPIPLSGWIRRRQQVHYELLAEADQCDGDGEGLGKPGLRVALRRGFPEGRPRTSRPGPHSLRAAYATPGSLGLLPEQAKTLPGEPAEHEGMGR